MKELLRVLFVCLLYFIMYQYFISGLSRPAFCYIADCLSSKSHNLELIIEFRVHRLSISWHMIYHIQAAGPGKAKVRRVVPLLSSKQTLAGTSPLISLLS